MKKQTIKTVAAGTLLCPAIFFTLFSRWTAFPWMGLMCLLGAPDAAFPVLALVILLISAATAGIFIRLDLLGKSSAKSRRFRRVYSVVVCLLVVVSTVRTEAGRIKGWSSEEAALSVASSMYPEHSEHLELRVEKKEDVPVLTRGPYIVYLVHLADQPVCRVGVCRRYWSYWTCGLSETLMERKTQQELAP